MKKILKSFSDLKGCTLLKVIESDTDEEIIFILDDCSSYKLYEYDNDCCDVRVSINDVVGDVNDLIGTPILLAEEVSNKVNKEGSYHTSTWTFYKLSTIKGSVTITWYGESNGYYSEKASWGIVELFYTPYELESMSKDWYVKGEIVGRECERNNHLKSLEKVSLDCSSTSKFLKELPIELLSKKVFPNSIPKCYTKELDFKCPFLTTISIPCCSTSDLKVTVYADAKVISKCMYLDRYLVLGYNEPMNICPFNNGYVNE